jgi:hypothetical protein
MTTTATVRPTLGVLPLADGSFAVASSDPTNPPYLVRAEGAALVCTCKAWQYRRPDSGACKHGLAVRAYLREQEAERLRTETRWCLTCGVSPVVDGFAHCTTCTDRQAEELDGRVRTQEGLLSGIDWAAEQARVAAANARAEVILVGPREMQREVLL